MKKLKKVMALSLAAVTAAGMLAACGGGEDAQTAKSDKPELNILMNNIK
ncbi:MAG TPA: C4-dicarboxylate ABC transporter substrate-binding protein, partial [Candidatus Ornithomonoglobus intestinigallinarum]|nr:C4-dicarboxylate ABC transporter substrate-binding protein [Candidatus Ornithomonoglobus intestinigallinarum]